MPDSRRRVWVRVDERDLRGRLRALAISLSVLAALAVIALALPGRGPGDGPVGGPGPDDEPVEAASPPGDVRDVTASTVSAEAGVPTLGFAATGLAGGGFQNVVAFAPDGAVALLGGDNSGLHRSTDAGLTWTPVSSGLPDWAAKVAAVAFHPQDPTVVVVGAGFSGRTGGVLRSDDGGETWAVASEEIAFSGANTPSVDAVPRGHPRATGDLLVWIDDVLFAATFDEGVHRSTDGGASWEQLGLAGLYLRGLAVADDGTLLVASHGDGLWQVEDPTGAARSTQLDGPRDAEELAVDGDTVLVAAGDDGLWTWDRASDDWVRSLDTLGPVTTVEVAGDVWWAGLHRPDVVEDDREGGVWRSDDRGATWTAVARGDGLEPVLAGVGLPWWVDEAQGSFMPDGSGWTAAQFAIDPRDPDTVLLAGRAGAWRSDDGGATWRAAVAGLGATAHDEAAVAADGRIAIANTDHRLLVSDDGLRTVRAIEPGESKGTAVAADVTGPPGTMLVATGERDANVDGELYRIEAGSDVFASLGLGDVVDGRRVAAVTSGFDADGEPVVLAAVEAGGLWRLADGDWQRVATDAFAGRQESPDGDLVWIADQQLVLALDRTSGLYVSRDAGRTWELVEGRRIEADRTDPAGFVVADGTVEGRAWLATRTELLRFDGLLGGTPAVTSLPVDAPGPLVSLPDGGVVVATRDSASVAPRLLHVCGGAIAEVTTGPRFVGGAIDATDLDLDLEGHLVLTTTTNGVLRSTTSAVAALPCAGAAAP